MQNWNPKIARLKIVSILILFGMKLAEYSFNQRTEGDSYKQRK